LIGLGKWILASAYKIHARKTLPEKSFRNFACSERTNFALFSMGWCLSACSAAPQLFRLALGIEVILNIEPQTSLTKSCVVDKHTTIRRQSHTLPELTEGAATQSAPLAAAVVGCLPLSVWRTFIVCGLALNLIAPDLWAQPASRILIRLDGQNTIHVEEVNRPSFRLRPTDQGLIVWSSTGSEHWQHIAKGGKWSDPKNQTIQRYTTDLAHQSRGNSHALAAPIGGRMTLQLDQLLGQVVVRGTTFVTPHNGFVLDGHITIRRKPLATQPHYPSEMVTLRRGNSQLAKFEFGLGQQKLAFDQIAALVEKFPSGLPAGEYSLSTDTGSATALFTIEDSDWRDAMLAMPRRFAELVGSVTDPLVLQISVENLLDQRDEDGILIPYFSDALDLLEQVPYESLTQHLQGTHLLGTIPFVGY
jgi:hypothetical protein